MAIAAAGALDVEDLRERFASCVPSMVQPDGQAIEGVG